MANTKLKTLKIIMFLSLSASFLISFTSCSPVRAIPYAIPGPLEISEDEDIQIRQWVIDNNYKEIFKFAALKWDNPNIDVSGKYTFYKSSEVQEWPNEWVDKNKFSNTYKIIFYARDELTNITDELNITVNVLLEI